MTAAETWRYGGDDIPYSMYVGGVGEMPNGSRFIASTGVKLYKEGSQCGAKGVRKARLLGDPSDANLGQSFVRTAMTFVRGSDALTSPSSNTITSLESPTIDKAGLSGLPWRLMSKTALCSNFKRFAIVVKAERID